MMVENIMLDHTKMVNQSVTKGSKLSERASLLKISRQGHLGLHIADNIIYPTLPIPILKVERFLLKELKITHDRFRLLTIRAKPCRVEALNGSHLPTYYPYKIASKRYLWFP